MANSISQNLRSFDSSRQLALGLAMGVLIGLLPKDNLVFAGLLVCLIASGASLLTGAVAGFIVTFAAATTEPWAIQVGELLFQRDWIVAGISDFMQMPVAPWTRLDDSLVAGELVIGITMFLPIYLVSYYVFEKYHQVLQTTFRDSVLTTWIMGYPESEDQD